MKNVKGIWLPDHEEHMKVFAHEEGWRYQGEKQDIAMELCIARKTAIDIGAHCGTWSMNLTKVFEEVHAFEPCMEHRECFEMNVSGNYTLYPFALGNKEMRASLNIQPGSSGNSVITAGDDVDVKLLDSFHVKPDFIKIDCEGFEYFVIQGGEETIKEFHPVMVVEQKPGNGSHFGLTDTQAIELLKSWGYKVNKVSHGDYFLTWS